MCSGTQKIQEGFLAGWRGHIEAPSNEAPHMLRISPGTPGDVPAIANCFLQVVTAGKAVQSWFVFAVVHVDEDLKPSSFYDLNEEQTQL